MVTYLREVNHRNLYFQRYKDSPDWVVAEESGEHMQYIILHAPTNDIEYLSRLSEKVTAYLPGWIATVGEHCELLHDIIDETWVMAKIQAEEEGDTLPFLMTTWEADISEALWFACFAADEDDIEIKDILFVDAANFTIEQIEAMNPEW